MQKIIKKNILVTGVGGPAGINITKLLMKEKKFFNIFGLDINSHSAGQFFSHQYFIGERVADEKKYLDFTIKFIQENKIDILIPTVAEELVLMDKLNKRLKNKNINCDIVVSSHKVLELCDQKDELYKWMEKNFPEYMGRWVRLDGKQKIWKSDMYFIKPVKGRGSRGCRAVTSAELKFLLKNNSTEMKDFVAMEILPGREWTVDAYINSDGSFAYIVPRLRLGLSGGISSLGRTDKNQTVIKQTEEVLKKLGNTYGLRGPVFIQWKEHKEGKVKMVEINPRASGGLTITVLAGANPVKCLKNEIFGLKKSNNMKWKEITVVRYFEEKVV